MTEPSPARQEAMRRQVLRGNSPGQTRLTWEEMRDFPRNPLTGPYYRKQMLVRLKMRETHNG